MRHLPRTVFVAGVCTLAVSLASAMVDARLLKKASRFTQRGDRAFGAGNVEEAKASFEKALESVPEFPDAHIGLGKIAMSEKRFEEALERFEQARDGYTHLGESLFEYRAKRYTESRENIASLQDSIRQLQSTVTAGEQSAMAARRSAQISQLENAIRQLEAVQPPNRSEADEPPGEIYFYVGNALFQLGRVAEAVGAWENCRTRSPEFPLVYNNLAVAYWRTGRVDEARTSLAKAEELGFRVDPRFKADLDKASD